MKVLRSALRVCGEFACFLCVGVSAFLSRVRPKALRISKYGKPLVLIDAGLSGWSLIEYKELYGSAVDFLGEASVLKLSIPDRSGYLPTVLQTLKIQPVTHYFYDPRTGSQSELRALYEAASIAVRLQRLGVVPIARITDVPVRRWRKQVRLIAKPGGVVVSLMAPDLIAGLFPGRQICGPQMMPLSLETLRFLQERWVAADEQAPRFEVLFAGSLYEPRATELQTVRTELESSVITMSVFERRPGEERDPEGSYWNRLLNSKVVFTTASQAVSSETDTFEVPHLIYRYTEALAAGVVLVAPRVHGADALFRPMVDFVAFDTLSEASVLIQKLLADEAWRKDVAESGRHRVTQLVQSNEFWSAINRSLAKESRLVLEQARPDPS